MTAMSTPRTTGAPLRVIQWTTGNIGRRSLHAIIGRPDLELVGVYAHGADKVGKDAAELSGWPTPTGIVSLWEPVGGAAEGVPFVVFAGNVGDDQALAEVVATLRTRPAG